MTSGFDPWISGAVVALLIGGVVAGWSYLSDRAFTRKYGSDPK